MIKYIVLAVFAAALPAALYGQADGQGWSADALSRMEQAVEEIRAADDAYTPLDEYTIGRALGATLLSRYAPARNRQAMTAYLNRICQALVENSPNPALYNGYHVMILESGQINAFATPGGHIFVTTALVDCARSEDVLAAALAHEVAHIQLRHSIDAIQAARTVQQLMALGSQALQRAARNQAEVQRRRLFEESVRAAVDIILNSGYSQLQEFGADEMALELLAGAGYQPSALTELLLILQQRQSPAAGGFYSTHPAPGLRINNINRVAGHVRTPADTRPFRQERFQAASIRSP